MPVIWKLKEICLKQNIKTTQELQNKIKAKTNTIISIQALYNLLNKTPKSFKIKTIEILCKTLDIEFQELLNITAYVCEHNKPQQIYKKQLNKNNNILSPADLLRGK